MDYKTQNLIIITPIESLSELLFNYGWGKSSDLIDNYVVNLLIVNDQ